MGRVKIGKVKIIFLAIIWGVVILISMSSAKKVKIARTVINTSHAVNAQITAVSNKVNCVRDEDDSSYKVYLVQTYKVSYFEDGNEYVQDIEGTSIHCGSASFSVLTDSEKNKYINKYGKSVGDSVPIYVLNHNPSKAYLRSKLDSLVSSDNYKTKVILLCAAALIVSFIILGSESMLRNNRRY